MKKRFLLIFVIFIVIGFCGCDKKEKSNNEENNGDFREKLNCTSLSNIKISNTKKYPEDEVNGGFLTSTGEYYYFGNFSDGTNCKKAEMETKIVKISGIGDGLFFIDENNKVYEYSSKKLDEVDLSKINNWRLRLLYDDSSSIKNTDGPLNVIGSYILKDDGKIYLYDFNNQMIDIISFEGEKVLDYSLYSNELYWIKTDKAMYIRQVKDKKCFDYDDIECEYEFVKNEKLTKKYSDIAFLEGDCKVFFKDGSIYINYC